MTHEETLERSNEDAALREARAEGDRFVSKAERGADMTTHTEGEVETTVQHETGAEIVERLITKARDEAERHVEAINLAAPLLDIAARAREAFPDLDIGEPDLGTKITTVQGVRVSVHGLTRFSEVTELLRWVRRQGLPFRKSEDYAEIERRTYIFGDGLRPHEVLNVMAFLRYDAEGASCRRVPTGETRPVYKLVCDDSEQEFEGP